MLMGTGEVAPLGAVKLITNLSTAMLGLLINDYV